MAPGVGADEPTAKANYSLGIVMALRSAAEQAIEHLSAAVQYQPNYGEAHLALGDALRRAGRFADSMSHYEEAVRINPRSRLHVSGTRWPWYGCGGTSKRATGSPRRAQLQPDRAGAGARAGPCAGCRSRRSRARWASGAEPDRTADRRSRRTPMSGETLAMALAELGDYRQAATIQREVIDAAQRAGLPAAAARMRAEPEAVRGGDVLAVHLGPMTTRYIHPGRHRRKAGSSFIYPQILRWCHACRACYRRGRRNGFNRVGELRVQGEHRFDAPDGLA